jgi:formylglycine-generating enzyme required for sulfatase activity
MPVVGAACIDAHEAPGAGHLPDTGVSFTEAMEACRARGLRLCGLAEWRAACAGPDGAAWPYGAAAERGACNTGSRSAIVATGSFARCRSASGAYDLAGNVAEWLADGTIAGGSAIDGSDGRCDAPLRTTSEAARFADVGFRCCGDL